MAQALPYNRVLTFMNPANGELVAVPIVWPDHREDRWINDQIEAQALRLAAPDPAEARAVYERGVLDIDAAIKGQSFPHTWKTMPWSTEHEEWLQAPKFPPEAYAHQKTQGFMGAYFNWRDFLRDDGAFATWHDWELLIGLFAQVKVAGRALRHIAADAPASGGTTSWEYKRW